jgi:hypothetical protein
MEVVDSCEAPEAKDGLIFDLFFSPDGTYLPQKISRLVHPSQY